MSKKGGVEHAFSEQHWGTATSSYSQLVARWTPQALQDIVRMAHAVLQDNCDGDSSVDNQSEGSVEGDVNSCGFMCKSLMSFIYHTDAFIEFFQFQGLHNTPSLPLFINILLSLKTHTTTYYTTFLNSCFMLVFGQAGCHAVYYTTTPLCLFHTAHSLGVVFLATRHSLHLSLITSLLYKVLFFWTSDIIM